MPNPQYEEIFKLIEVHNKNYKSNRICLDTIFNSYISNNLNNIKVD